MDSSPANVVADNISGVLNLCEGPCEALLNTSTETQKKKKGE